MQHSKFVNTKAHQKAQKGSMQFPIFGRSNANESNYHKAAKVELGRIDQNKTVEMKKPDLAEPETSPSALAETREAKEAAKIHASINFEQMQKMEDLNRVDDDWAAFFLGKTEAVAYSESTDLVPVTSSFDESTEHMHDAIVPPPPTAAEYFQTSMNFELDVPVREKSEECLDNIFGDMISDDKGFSQEARG